MNTDVNNKNKNINKAYLTGGEVIASGGYGCVFKPALRCKNKKRRKNMISKLMIESHTISEYDKIKSINDKLKNIPNYLDYFLLENFSICKPDKLTNSDLQKFEKRCKALPKDDINKENINDSLYKLLSLNLPFGGLPVDDYIFNNVSNQYDGSKKIIELNNSLIHLLENGIIPMNKKFIYHLDIKDSNILANNENENVYARLIDWGLSSEYNPNTFLEIPRIWKRPLQFNLPFSVILFTDFFHEKYKVFLNKAIGLTKEEQDFQLTSFVKEYFIDFTKEKGIGHYKYINTIMYYLFGNEAHNYLSEEQKVKWVESEITVFYITNYIVTILKHFTHFGENPRFDSKMYIDKVYIHLVDVWGFITAYLPLLEILSNNYNKLNKENKKLFNHLKYIFIHYLYSPRIDKIPINDLVMDLTKINSYVPSLFMTDETKSINNSLSTSSIFKKYTKKNIKKIRSNMKKKSIKRYKHLFLQG